MFNMHTSRMSRHRRRRHRCAQRAASIYAFITRFLLRLHSNMMARQRIRPATQTDTNWNNVSSNIPTTINAAYGFAPQLWPEMACFYMLPSISFRRAHKQPLRPEIKLFTHVHIMHFSESAKRTNERTMANVVLWLHIVQAPRHDEFRWT